MIRFYSSITHKMHQMAGYWHHHDSMVRREVSGVGCHAVGTFCQFHRLKCATEVGTAAAYAEEEMRKKYTHLNHSYSFQRSCCLGNIGLSWCGFHGLLERPWPMYEDGHRS